VVVGRLFVVVVVGGVVVVEDVLFLVELTLFLRSDCVHLLSSFQREDHTPHFHLYHHRHLRCMNRGIVRIIWMMGGSYSDGEFCFDICGEVLMIHGTVMTVAVGAYLFAAALMKMRLFDFAGHVRSVP